MVRLITHNLLACHVKGCESNNFPLAFKDAQIEIRETDFNSEFLRGFMPKIEWHALTGASRQVRTNSGCFEPELICVRSWVTRLFLSNNLLRRHRPKNSSRRYTMSLWRLVYRKLWNRIIPYAPAPRFMSKKAQWYARIAGMNIKYRGEYRTWSVQHRY